MSAAEPWSKWFWTDYEADPGLRMSSLAAQGLWMRMLCLMAKSSPKGELRVGDEPCTMADLAVYVGQSEETVVALVGELERRSVFSRTRAGVIYNRRLRKDAELSKKRAKAGAKGAEATNLKLHGNQDLPQQNDGKPSGKRAAPEARSQKPEARQGDSNLPPDVRSILAEGGYVSPPGDLSILREWYNSGATLDQDILPCIRRVRPTLRKPPFTLKVFDAAIREKLAQDEVEIEHLRRVARRNAEAEPVAATRVRS